LKPAASRSLLSEAPVQPAAQGHRFSAAAGWV